MALRGMWCAHMATVPAGSSSHPTRCCRWSGEVCGRQRAAPHMKSYLRCGRLLRFASLLSKSTGTIQCVEADLRHGTAPLGSSMQPFAAPDPAAGTAAVRWRGSMWAATT